MRKRERQDGSSPILSVDINDARYCFHIDILDTRAGDTVYISGMYTYTLLMSSPNKKEFTAEDNGRRSSSRLDHKRREIDRITCRRGKTRLPASPTIQYLYIPLLPPSLSLSLSIFFVPFYGVMRSQLRDLFFLHAPKSIMERLPVKLPCLRDT